MMDGLVGLWGWEKRGRDGTEEGGQDGRSWDRVQGSRYIYIFSVSCKL